MDTKEPQGKMVFMPVSDERWDAIFKHVEKTFPNTCIYSIYEVINNELSKKYEKYKKLHPTFKQSGLVYHGTKDINNITPIISEGYKVKYNVTSAYGKGTYFSTKWTYSKKYSKKREDGSSYILLNYILIPEYYKCPEQHIYVIKDDDAILPMYVIEYIQFK